MKHGSTEKTIASPVLTVAIPAYNVEAYLNDCLESLTTPKLQSVEVLVIDDGSTDDTAAIAARFSEKYPYIRLISKHNGGHGSAINAALKLARGKYFKLLDGDDFYDPKSLIELISFLATTDNDIVLTDYLEYYMTSATFKSINNYRDLSTAETYSTESGERIFDSVGPILATTTFKTELYTKDPFHIDEHCFYVDAEYNFFVYQRAKTFTYLELPLYAYRLEREGQSMDMSSLKKNYSNHEKVCMRLIDELSNIPKDSPVYRYLFNYIVAPFCRSHYQILIEYLKDRNLFLAFDKALSAHPFLYHSPSISGKIINIHRAGRGLTIVSDNLLRNFGGVLNSFGKK